MHGSAPRAEQAHGSSQDDLSISQDALSLAALAQHGLGILSPGKGAELSCPLPFENRICLMEDTRVAGTTHVAGIDDIVHDIHDGQELRFEREKGNLQDGWAIKVFAGQHRIGYVPCDRNEIVARLMDGGKHVYGTVASIEKLGNWNKIRMEVYLDD